MVLHTSHMRWEMAAPNDLHGKLQEFLNIGNWHYHIAKHCFKSIYTHYTYASFFLFTQSISVPKDYAGIVETEVFHVCSMEVNIISR